MQSSRKTHLWAIGAAALLACFVSSVPVNAGEPVMICVIENQATGTALGVPAQKVNDQGNPIEAAKLELKPGEEPDTRFQWLVVPCQERPNCYYLYNRRTDKRLDHDVFKMKENGSSVGTWAAAGDEKKTLHQTWELIPILKDGSPTLFGNIRCVGSDKVLDIALASGSVQMWDRNDGPQQAWTLKPIMVGSAKK